MTVVFAHTTKERLKGAVGILATFRGNTMVDRASGNRILGPLSRGGVESLEDRILMAADAMPGCLMERVQAESELAGVPSPQLARPTKGLSQTRFGAIATSPLDESFSPMAPPPEAGDPRELQPPVLHSKPDSPYKIFLDFDGHVVTDPYWTTFNNDLPIHAPPYTIDTDFFSYSPQELLNMQEIFDRMAEDFAPFDVNVTTEDPGEAFFAAGNQGIRVMMSSDVDEVSAGGTGNRWFLNAGGVAYLDSWTFQSDTPVWVFTNRLQNGNPKRSAEAGSHEVGHSFGLLHDGLTNGTAYYRGHGGGETGWAPIMGVGYDRNLTQWSKGEYFNANNLETDLEIMTQFIPYRSDDHASQPASAASATPLVPAGSFHEGAGIIEQSSDIDVFRVQVLQSGPVVIDVLPQSVGPNLDILAELRDASGMVVASSNPADLLSAQFSLSLAAGTYTLAIDGTGKGNPQGTGYSDYASLGQYTIRATLPAGLRGDFNADQTVNAQDIDLLCGAIRGGTNPASFDLTGDAIVNTLDMDELIRNILNTQYGDANLDRVVDGSDFGLWNSNKFGSGGWAQGDFSCDGVVDGSDFGIWNQNKFTGQARPTGTELAGTAVIPPRPQEAPFGGKASIRDLRSLLDRMAFGQPEHDSF